MKKLEFTTSKGEFILEEASDKNLGRVLVKYMTEEQFAEVVDSELDSHLKPNYKDYLHDRNSGFEDEYAYYTAKQSFESLIKSLGWCLFENPVKMPLHPICDSIMEESIHDKYRKRKKDWTQAECKTLYNPVLLIKL